MAAVSIKDTPHQDTCSARERVGHVRRAQDGVKLRVGFKHMQVRVHRQRRVEVARAEADILDCLERRAARFPIAVVLGAVEFVLQYVEQ